MLRVMSVLFSCFIYGASIKLNVFKSEWITVVVQDCINIKSSTPRNIHPVHDLYLAAYIIELYKKNWILGQEDYKVFFCYNINHMKVGIKWNFNYWHHFSSSHTFLWVWRKYTSLLFQHQFCTNMECNMIYRTQMLTAVCRLKQLILTPTLLKALTCKR